MRIIVIGAGEVGYHIAERLAHERRHDITLIERNPAVCQKVEETLDLMVIQADGSSPRALEQAGIREAELVIAVADVDEGNIVACAVANQYGVLRKIARVRDLELAEHPILAGGTVLGIDLLINPNQITADENNAYAVLGGAITGGQAGGNLARELENVRHVVYVKHPGTGIVLEESATGPVQIDRNRSNGLIGLHGVPKRTSTFLNAPTSSFLNAAHNGRFNLISPRHALEITNNQVAGVRLGENMMTLLMLAVNNPPFVAPVNGTYRSIQVLGNQFENEDNVFMADEVNLSNNQFLSAATANGFFDYIDEPVPIIAAMRELTDGKLIMSFPKAVEWRVPVRRLRFWMKGTPLFLYREQQVRDILEQAGVHNYEFIYLDRDYLVVAEV